MATKRAVYQTTEFKAVANSPGEFTAVVSVFNNVDLVGDRVMPGAFKNSLAQWKQSGDPIPVIWSHDWDDPFAHIGVVSAATETPVGLQITGKLDLDKPFAKQVYDLLIARRVKEFSFAYEVISEVRAKDGANNLVELGLTEVGPTLKGCNPETDLVNVKGLLDAAAEQEREAAKGISLEVMSGRKVYLDAEIPGSFDETEETIRTAAQALFNPTDDEGVYVWIQATFPDYAIVQVCRDGEDDQNFQVAWADDGADGVTLGEPAAVEVSVAITPKSAKAGRRVSSSTHSEMTARHSAYGKALEALTAAHDANTEFLSTLNNATADDAKSYAEQIAEGIASASPALRAAVADLLLKGGEGASALIDALQRQNSAAAGFKTFSEQLSDTDELRQRIEAAKAAKNGHGQEPQARPPDLAFLALRTRIEETRATQ